MTQKIPVLIYGDSIMKATVVEQGGKMKFTFQQYVQQLEQAGLEVCNRAKFGATVEKGRQVMEQDLEKAVTARYALLCFGGNDCDHDWQAVAAAPEAAHQPHTVLSAFLQTLTDMARRLLAAGIQPVFMTLPPIDAERYLREISRRGADQTRVLQWLGDTQRIYRFHELYSDAVARLAERLRQPLIDVRTRFLERRDCRSLIAADGIHLTGAGYGLLCDTFCLAVRA